MKASVYRGRHVTLHSYLLFAGASVVLAIVPGPDMIYMLGRCVAQGRKVGVMAALGFNLGGYAHLTAAILGLSAVLATSVVAFTVVKWLGAGYLIYLGINTLRSRDGRVDPATQNVIGPAAKTILWQAFLSDVLNPKVAMFFTCTVTAICRRGRAAPGFADAAFGNHDQCDRARLQPCASETLGFRNGGATAEQVVYRMAERGVGRHIPRTWIASRD
jgi:threonine/homoserine/homoserine lactone efflux protein